MVMVAPNSTYQPAYLFLLVPYKRKRLKAEIHERTTILRLTTKALAIPSPIWLQNFPYMLHTFIHWSSACPVLPSTPDCNAAATAATVTYAITCTNRYSITLVVCLDSLSHWKQLSPPVKSNQTCYYCCHVV